jgi:hypothetical protein
MDVLTSAATRDIEPRVELGMEITWRRVEVWGCGAAGLNHSAQQTHIAGFAQCLLAIIDFEFAKQIVDMGFDRAKADEQ